MGQPCLPPERANTAAIQSCLAGAPSAFWYLARRSAGGGIRNACNLCACWSLCAAHACRRHSGRQRHRVGSGGGGVFSVSPSKRLCACAPQHSGLSGSPHRSPTQAHQAWPASLIRFRWMVQAAFRFRFTPRRSCMAHACWAESPALMCDVFFLKK